MRNPQYIAPFLNAGRLVYLRKKETIWGWGVLANMPKEKMGNKEDEKVENEGASFPLFYFTLHSSIQCTVVECRSVGVFEE